LHLDPKPPSGDSLEQLAQVIVEAASRDRNEAETRHKIIDFVIHQFLAWPRNRVAVEENIHPGYADYILKKTNGEDWLFIEAKRAGLYFDLPVPNNPSETSTFIAIKKLLTDDNIRAAMEQVRKYCFDSGCEYACVTNGHEWIFFKTFEKGKRWETLQAFVVRSLEFFRAEYTKAWNNLSFVAIAERSSLPSLLASAPPKDRGLFYPKEKINAYSHTINANRLAAALRPVITRYFGVIGDHETEFMDRCYVLQRDYQDTSKGMRSIIQDSLSPYFAEFGVKQLEDSGKGGQLGGRLTKNIKYGRKGEVLVLFGGTGSGKSTFIKRLLHHKPPKWLRDHSVVAIVDLLDVPEDKQAIHQAIWAGLVSSLDSASLLKADRSNLLAGLFSDRFETAKKQQLSGLSPSSEVYNVKLNELVQSWRSDFRYCAARLVEYWKTKDKGAIVVVDNTDQYSSPLQDFCFSTAQEISSALGSVTLISMREERFHNSKIHGLLDAFQNSGFHISSPKPADVFKKRLEYVMELLSVDRRRRKVMQDVEPGIVQDSKIYLHILYREFSDEKSPLNAFLSACAHGNIRLSLDLFRSFALSGYTNVDEMISKRRWNFLIHQVIKPVMTPSRYFYDEKLSDIPNVYQVRHTRHGSHFTALRILRKLAKSVDASSPAYVSVVELASYFADTFNMVDDYVRNLDMLLKHGFVEANNRVDAYSEDVDQIKITNYGIYLLNELAYNFTYLDLISTDCGIYNETVHNYLIEAARSEYNHFVRHERLKRVELRAERVGHFIEYLKAEEHREKDAYSLGMPDAEMFTFKPAEGFEDEKNRVLASARKNQGTKAVRG
jgi:energy-coupling factor transporter ATP-binding protein EcfA2